MNGGAHFDPTPEGSSQFDGSYDWHSDVHAHWALLSIARITNDAKLEAWLQSTLNLNRMKREFKAHTNIRTHRWVNAAALEQMKDVAHGKWEVRTGLNFLSFNSRARTN